MDNICRCCAKLLALTRKELLHSSGLDIESRLGLCAACLRAGCNGVSPCMIQPTAWLLKDRLDIMHEAREFANEMDVALQQIQPAVKGRSERTESRDAWMQAAEGYWRKELQSVVGRVVAEMLRVRGLDGYYAQMRVVETPNSEWSGHIGETISFEVYALPVEEALAECDAQIETFIEMIVSEGKNTSFLSVEIRPRTLDQN